LDVISPPEVAALPLVETATADNRTPEMLQAGKDGDLKAYARAQRRRDNIENADLQQLTEKNAELQEQVKTLTEKNKDLKSANRQLKDEVANLKADRDRWRRRAEARLTEVSGEEQADV
jgi:predicted RNase H-like nuclease (RuvC/YqgF family)